MMHGPIYIRFTTIFIWRKPLYNECVKMNASGYGRVGNTIVGDKWNKARINFMQ